MDRSVGECALW